MNRPSKRELGKKIKAAKEAVQNNKILLVSPEVIARDAIELGYQIKTLNKVLSNLLNEFTIENYVGSYPPQKAYEQQIKGSELFAFRWMSEMFNQEVYLKFTFKHKMLYLVSLHEHKQKKGWNK